MNTTLEQLQARLLNLETGNAALKADSDALRAEMAKEHQHNRRERRRLRVQAALALTGFVASVFALPANRTAMAQGYTVTLDSLNTRLLAVEAKTQFQFADSTAKNTTFSGCNVIVNDGGGSTSNIVQNAAGQGLGNIIIGYNAQGWRASPGDIRTGSHNLILGDSENYTSYGGIAVGLYSSITAPNASVTGGYANTASSAFATVTGGYQNTASGSYSSVSGGYGNRASGGMASASGGQGNTALGSISSVSGGINKVNADNYGWTGGALHNP